MKYYPVPWKGMSLKTNSIEKVLKDRWRKEKKLRSRILRELGKLMTYVSNDSKWSRYGRVDMIMKTHELLWDILFSNQKSGASGVFRNLGPTVSLQNI